MDLQRDIYFKHRKLVSLRHCSATKLQTTNVWKISESSLSIKILFMNIPSAWFHRRMNRQAAGWWWWWAVETATPGQAKFEPIVGNSSLIKWLNNWLGDHCWVQSGKSKVKWKSNRILQQMFSQFSDTVVNVWSIACCASDCRMYSPSLEKDLDVTVAFYLNSDLLSAGTPNATVTDTV